MDEIRQIAINQIVPSKTNPRTAFDEGKLNELARSIKRSGVVQPLLVRRLTGEMYELIAGERRLRASQRAGLAKVPCVVRELSESETLEVQIVENAQRAGDFLQRAGRNTEVNWLAFALKPVAGDFDTIPAAHVTAEIPHRHANVGRFPRRKVTIPSNSGVSRICFKETYFGNF